LYGTEKLWLKVLNKYARNFTTERLSEAELRYLRDEVMSELQGILNILREDAEVDKKQTIGLEKAKKMAEVSTEQDNQSTGRNEEAIIQHGKDIKGVQEVYKYQQINHILEQRLRQFKQQKAEKLKLLRERYEVENQELKKRHDRERQFKKKKYEHEQFLMKKMRELIRRRSETSSKIEGIYHSCVRSAT
jgi:hypothetical protein